MREEKKVRLLVLVNCFTVNTTFVVFFFVFFRRGHCFLLPHKMRIDDEDSRRVHFILNLSQSFTADPKREKREPVLQSDTATFNFFLACTTVDWC